MSRRMMVVLAFAMACGGAHFGLSESGAAPAGEPVPEAGPPSKWTLEEQGFWKKLQEEMDETAKKANDHCHSRVSGTYVAESFRGRLTEGGSYGLAQYTRSVCNAALFALRDLCTNGDNEKKAVAAGIRRVECEFGPTKYTLTNGTFRVRIDATDDQYDNYLRSMMDFVQKHL